MSEFSRIAKRKSGPFYAYSKRFGRLESNFNRALSIRELRFFTEPELDKALAGIEAVMTEVREAIACAMSDYPHFVGAFEARMDTNYKKALELIASHRQLLSRKINE
ncbi:MAG: hypothetical protein N4A36_00375 [Candidatus Gracilibacteria bacterium]|jgi:hypothetical protein|nr:hypothetical protein [Candidatus Gracilibacteria bacterium]